MKFLPNPPYLKRAPCLLFLLSSHLCLLHGTLKTCSRFEVFRERLNEIRVIFTTERGESPMVSMSEVMEQINDGVGEDFTVREVRAQIVVMSEMNMAVWWQPENESIMFL